MSVNATNSTSSYIEPFSITETSALLRLVTIFVIMTTGFGGVAIPIFFRRWSSSHFFTVAKAFGAGVVLGTGYIHVFPTSLNSTAAAFPKIDYPLGALFALAATVITLGFEQIAGDFFALAHGETEHDCSKGGECNSQHAVVPAPDGKGDITIVSCVELDQIPKATTPTATDVAKEHALVVAHIHGDAEIGRLESVGHRFHHHHQHSHVTEGAPAKGKEKNASIVAHVLEVGISLHSVIIGLALGVSSDVVEIRALLIALCFHQFFEGIALGVSVAEAGLGKTQRVVAICSFTFATPIGVAIGLTLASQQSSNSRGLLIAQGVLDSISAGILIFMALVDMISDSFQSPHIENRRCLRLAMIAAIFFGASVMALIGLWA